MDLTRQIGSDKEIVVLLVGLDKIALATFDEYVCLIDRPANRRVRLADQVLPATLCDSLPAPFAPYRLGTRAVLDLHFVPALASAITSTPPERRPRVLRTPRVSIVAPARRPLAVIGLLDASSMSGSWEDAQQQLERFVTDALHPRPLATRLLALDTPHSLLERVGGDGLEGAAAANVTIVPSSQGDTHTAFFLSSILNDVAVALLSELVDQCRSAIVARDILARQIPARLPDGLLVDTELVQQHTQRSLEPPPPSSSSATLLRRLLPARLDRRIGDLAVLIDQPQAAMHHYDLAATRARQAHDPLTAALVTESRGTLLALSTRVSPDQRPFIAPQAPTASATIDSLVDLHSSAYALFHEAESLNVTACGCAQLEARVRLTRLLIDAGRREQAIEALSCIASLSLPTTLVSSDRVHLYRVMGDLFRQLNHARKAALFTFMAATLHWQDASALSVASAPNSNSSDDILVDSRLSLSSSTTTRYISLMAARQSLRLLLDTLPAVHLPTLSLDGIWSSMSPSTLENDRFLGRWRRPLAWPILQAQLLRDVAGLAHHAANIPVVIAALSFLLQRLHYALSASDYTFLTNAIDTLTRPPYDSLVDTLSTATDEKLPAKPKRLDTFAAYADTTKTLVLLPALLFVRPQLICDPPTLTSGLTSSLSPFIFSSLSSSSAAPDKNGPVWIQHEAAVVHIGLRNATEFDVRLDRISLLLDGDDDDTSILTESRPLRHLLASATRTTLALHVVPTRTGLLLIRGVRVRRFGVFSSLPLPTTVSVTVVEPLPLLHIDTSATLASVTLDAGEHTSLQVTLSNSGASPIESLAFSPPSSAGYRCVWPDLASFLPLVPQEQHTISLSIIAPVPISPLIDAASPSLVCTYSGSNSALTRSHSFTLPLATRQHLRFSDISLSLPPREHSSSHSSAAAQRTHFLLKFTCTSTDKEHAYELTPNIHTTPATAPFQLGPLAHHLVCISVPCFELDSDQLASEPSCESTTQFVLTDELRSLSATDRQWWRSLRWYTRSLAQMISVDWSRLSKEPSRRHGSVCPIAPDWLLSRAQLDFVTPDRFTLSLSASDDSFRLHLGSTTTVSATLHRVGQALSSAALDEPVQVSLAIYSPPSDDPASQPLLLGTPVHCFLPSTPLPATHSLSFVPTVAGSLSYSASASLASGAIVHSVHSLDFSCQV